MPVVINSNMAATYAAGNLSRTNAALQRSLNRLSSGSRIVNPADDAGGLAVSMKLSASARRMGAASTNLSNTQSYLQSQDGAMNVIGKVLNRMSELKTLSADPTKNTSDVANYNSEFTQLQQELSSISNEKFNGIGLFGTAGSNVYTNDSQSQSLSLQGADLFGATGSFTDTSQWTLTNASASGGSVTFDPTTGSSQAVTVQSIPSPLQIDLDIQFGTTSSTWGIEWGSMHTGVSYGAGISDTNVHHLTITIDSAGNFAEYVDHSSTALQTGSAGTTATAITMGDWGTFPNSVTTVSNFTVNGQPVGGGSGGNMGAVASASSLSSVSLSSITGAIQDLSTYRARNGAYQSRINSSLDLLTTNKANLEQANSRISDVDVAAESSELARANVLIQAGTAMLSQANQSSQVALKLIGG